jgi:hypothetical protein
MYFLNQVHIILFSLHTFCTSTFIANISYFSLFRASYAEYTKSSTCEILVAFPRAVCVCFLIPFLAPTGACGIHETSRFTSVS